MNPLIVLTKLPQMIKITHERKLEEMKQIVVGIDEARMVDDKGNIYRATKIGNRWIFQGRTYSSPFEAFKEVIK